MTEAGSEVVGSIGTQLRVRDDHWCFGCGRLNPCGLKLTFFEEAEGDGIWSPWTPERRHEGYDGIVHGGVITAVLDEVMAWAVYHRRAWAVTGKIALSFRRPVAIDIATRASARIIADRGRVLDVRGELLRSFDGVLLAEAAATFVRVPEEKARAWRDRYLVADDQHVSRVDE